jgi:hypothetical protein
MKNLVGDFTHGRTMQPVICWWRRNLDLLNDAWNFFSQVAEN